MLCFLDDGCAGLLAIDARFRRYGEVARGRRAVGNCCIWRFRRATALAALRVEVRNIVQRKQSCLVMRLSWELKKQLSFLDLVRSGDVKGKGKLPQNFYCFVLEKEFFFFPFFFFFFFFPLVPFIGGREVLLVRAEA